MMAHQKLSCPPEKILCTFGGKAYSSSASILCENWEPKHFPIKMADSKKGNLNTAGYYSTSHSSSSVLWNSQAGLKEVNDGNVFYVDIFVVCRIYCGKTCFW